MNFLRNLLAAILGCLIAFGIIFIMFFFLLALMGSADDTVTIKKNSVLEISFTEPIYDYQGKDESDPFAGLFEVGMGLDEILHAIKVAKNDENIKGISLNTGFLMAGMAQAQELRKVLQDFKENGKFVYAYSDFYTQKDYYLASSADKLYLNPQGGIDFKGLATEVLYYKELQEKSGIKMEVVRHGKYKSAVEPFLTDSMSDENRQQIKELITSLWNVMIDDIGESRGIGTRALNNIADTLGARMPEYAVHNGLVDELVFTDEYHQLIKTQLGLSEDDDIEYVKLVDYAKLANRKKLATGNDKIALIYAQGEIFYGEGDKDYLGQGLITRALKKAREDDRIKAVVLRVNSPGGNALTADIIWREVELTRKEKPMVVSFGNVAASGGYYIGVASDHIVAEPTTVTGSIGVFGTIPNVSELADNIGINAEQVGTNANSVDYSLFEPMSDSFRNVVQEGIEDTYQTFLKRVADGRGMSLAEVDAVAQGRVWSGVDAKRLGLVDALGGLDDALSKAAELAELESYGVLKYPKYKSDFERLMDDLEGVKSSIGQSFIKEEIGPEAYQVLRDLKQMIQQEGIQARMPYTLNIQ
ncbi:signal peptide peptidase SppA [Allomuricauda sp. SCSIO 65647]|uniref:signal peptide peptidase SppA n=1 Tax=Allomuricauda sp. SCSIO 65647 TaxID=2908843 RepID=UPI001F22AC74|nr:signal peptide peptidase SppA [Muricauda sp. SCSIO 65647]UJH68310.1 signal peptide peptidase SppA [Muricauda sp. SCSIO 65647]